MPVVIDATKSGELANSYCTVEEADAILDSIYGCEDWAGLDPDAKARLLITATNNINDLPIVYPSFVGNQSLAFPVNIAGLESGYDTAKKATAIQAFYLYENTQLFKDARADVFHGVHEKTISNSTEKINGINPYAYLSFQVYKLLKNFISLRVTSRRC